MPFKSDHLRDVLKNIIETALMHATIDFNKEKRSVKLMLPYNEFVSYLSIKIYLYSISRILANISTFFLSSNSIAQLIADDWYFDYMLSQLLDTQTTADKNKFN